MEYSPEVCRRLERPERRGVRESAGDSLISGTAEDRSLNVWVCVQVEVSAGTVAAVRYEAYGCPHFLAAAEWIAERIEGQALAALTEPLAVEAAAALDVPAEKRGKLLVIEDALAATAARLSGWGLNEAN